MLALACSPGVMASQTRPETAPSGVPRFTAIWRPSPLQQHLRTIDRDKNRMVACNDDEDSYSDTHVLKESAYGSRWKRTDATHAAARGHHVSTRRFFDRKNYCLGIETTPLTVMSHSHGRYGCTFFLL